MPTNKQLMEEVKRLREENETLHKRVSSFFIRTPEKSLAADKMREGYIPYMLIDKNLCVNEDEKHLPATYLIEGDNLGVLSALSYKYSNNVDVIYIDPPYNTRKRVYTYSDTYGDSRLKTDYREAFLRNHSAWLTYMEVRLTLARVLLRDTGIIMCSIGSEEHAPLRLLMDSIFGESNFIANITWTGALKNNARYISESSDYMLIYAKDIESTHANSPKWRAKKPSAQALIAIGQKIFEESNHDCAVATKELRKFYKTQDARDIFQTEPGLKMYNSIDENGKLYRAGDLSSPNGVGASYKVVNPNTGNEVTHPKRGWAHSEATFKEKIQNKEILWNGDKVPTYKRFLENSLDIVLKDSINRDRDAANKLLHKIIGKNKFSYPKDHHTLAEWIDYVTPEFRKKDLTDPPIIMDFFAGSASTAHAVAQLNATDGIKRACVVVTSDENGISRSVAAERMKALYTGKWHAETVEPLPGRLVFYSVHYTKATVPPKKNWGIVQYSDSYKTFIKSLVKDMTYQGLL